MKISFKNSLILSTIFSLLFISSLLVYYFASKPSQHGEEKKEPSISEITVIGTITCLPHKSSKGPQTLECAIGLKDEKEKYYALRDTDPSYKNISSFASNSVVEVKGRLFPQEDTKYQSEGIIEIISIVEAHKARRMTLIGDYICLPYKDTTIPQDSLCTLGLKTEDGLYYALDFQLSSQTSPNFKEGDKISVNGLFTPLVLLSTNKWDIYPIEGIFSVTDSAVKLE